MPTPTTTSQPPLVEEPCTYVFPITLTADQNLPQLTVPIDRDSDFLMTGIYGSSTSTFTINFQLPSGRQYASQPLNNTNLLGTANQPTAIGPPLLYRAQSNGPVLTLLDTSGASNTIEIVFVGVRQLRTNY